MVTKTLATIKRKQIAYELKLGDYMEKLTDDQVAQISAKKTARAIMNLVNSNSIAIISDLTVGFGILGEQLTNLGFTGYQGYHYNVVELTDLQNYPSNPPSIQKSLPYLNSGKSTYLHQTEFLRAKNTQNELLLLDLPFELFKESHSSRMFHFKAIKLILESPGNFVALLPTHAALILLNDSKFKSISIGDSAVLVHNMKNGGSQASPTTNTVVSFPSHLPKHVVTKETILKDIQ